MTSTLWQKSLVEMLVIPLIRNGNRVFVEYQKSRSNLLKPLAIQGKVTFVTTIYTYHGCVITRAGGGYLVTLVTLVTFPVVPVG